MNDTLIDWIKLFPADSPTRVREHISGGRLGPELASIKVKIPDLTQIGSNYRLASATFDTNYMSTPVEMFARAFECYVKDKMQANGVEHDFLSFKSRDYVNLESKLLVFNSPDVDTKEFFQKDMEGRVLEITDPDSTLSKQLEAQIQKQRQRYGYERHRYPVGKERDYINQTFDKLF